MKLDRIRDFLGDLWFDLRERKLAPAVIALGVAIVAVPFVLGGSDSTAPPASKPAPNVIETQPAVAVASEDGVRDGDERLTGRAPKNPFRQQLQSLPSSGEVADDEAGVAAGATQAAPAAGPEAEQAADQLKDQLDEAFDDAKETQKELDEGKLPADELDEGNLQALKYTANVRFGPLGDRKPFRGIDIYTFLPDRKEAIAMLLGFEPGGKAAVIALDGDRVTKVWGDGACRPRPDECAVVKLDPGETAKFNVKPAKDAGDARSRLAPGDAHGAAKQTDDKVIYSLTVYGINVKTVKS